MDIHIWVPRDPWGDPWMPWGGYLGGTDGTLGPMGPWDRWDLGLKDPGPQGPPINDIHVDFHIDTRPGPAPDAGCRAGNSSGQNFSNFFFPARAGPVASF